MEMTDNQLKLMQLRNYQAMPLGAKVTRSLSLIREWYEAHDGLVYVAFSGGKDSTVLLDLVWSIYPDVPAVFADTGNELNSVREFVETYGDRVVWVKPEMSFDEVVAKHGYPIISKKTARALSDLKMPKGVREASKKLWLTGITSSGRKASSYKLAKKWMHLIDAPFAATSKCCGILKINPTKPYRKETGRMQIVGTMASESRQRMTSYLDHGGCNAFSQSDPSSRPIMFWTEQDVLGYIKEFDIPISKAYHGKTAISDDTRFVENEDGTLKCAGHQRTGCKFCLFGVHLESKNGPNRIQRLYNEEPESYRHCIEDLHYDKVMDELGVDWRPYKQPDIQMDMLDERYEVDVDEL